MHGVGRRLRAEAAHAVPVVRPERRRRAAAQDRAAARRRSAGPRACSSSGTTRRPRSPRASPSRGDRRHRARSSSACGARGGTFQEWSEHFDLDRWLDAMAAEGLDPDWYVNRHRTEDEVLPWDHISAGLHKDFLWQDWQAALAEHGLARLPVDAVLRLRRVHRLRARARRGVGRSPPAGGSQGTGPGPRPAAAVPVRCRSRRHAAATPGRGGDARRARVRVRFTKRGKVRFISHRDVARVWERAFRIGPSCPLAFTEGFSPRPKVQLRARPVDRARDARPSTSTSSSPTSADPGRRARCPARSTAALPDGHRRDRRPRPLAAGAPSLQEAVTSCTWQIEVARRRPPTTAAAAVDRAARPPTSSPSTRERKGKRRHRRRPPGHPRPAVLGPATDGPLADGDGTPCARRAELATQPRGAPARRAARRARTRRAARAGCCGPTNGSSATARGGSRWPPTARRRAAHAEARAS